MTQKGRKAMIVRRKREIELEVVSRLNNYLKLPVWQIMASILLLMKSGGAIGRSLLEKNKRTARY